jgi:hypothetical protein
VFVTLAAVGSINKTVVQASLGRNQDPISKITRMKGAGGMAQVVESLPSKSKALSFNPSSAQRKKIYFESIIIFYIIINKIKFQKSK